MSTLTGAVVVLLAGVVVALPLPSQAQKPALSAAVASQRPRIDGDLSDQCWREIRPISDFYLQIDSSTPPESTLAWVCCDRDNIYVAFYSRDSQPDKICAEQKKRGGSMGSDDRVEINIDGYGTANSNRLMWFQVNPRGTQREVILTGSASKIEWRGDWEGASKRVPDGYTTEMAIPFSMLHYDPKRPNVCIMLSRYHARTRQWWRSPNVGPNRDPRLYYQLHGLEAPDFRKRPLLLAYSLLGTGSGHSEKPNAAGCDLKWDLAPDLTGVATYNPDFRNVEQEVESIDFTYTERYLEDSRPFFMEGGGCLPASNLLYTRRIDEISYGGKLIGQLRGYSVGLLHSNQPASDHFTALRISRDLQGRGQVALSGVQTRAAGGHNLATQIDGDYILHERDERRLNVSSSFSVADAASGDGRGRSHGFGLAYSKPNSLSWSIGHELVDPDYDPRLGFVPEKNLRSSGGAVSLRKTLPTGPVENWGVSLDLNYVDHLDGSKYHDSLGLSGSCGWRRGWYAYAGLSTSHRPPFHDTVTSLGCGWGGRSLYRTGGLDVAFGTVAGGDYRSYALYQARDIGSRLNVQVAYQNSRVDSPSELAYSSHQSVVTAAYDLDKERTLAGRFVSRNGRSNIYVTYRQKVRAGLDAYVIFGDPNADSTRGRLSVKLIRPM